MNIKIQFAFAFLLPALLPGWDAKFVVPVIPAQQQRLTERINQSLIDSNTGALQRSGREWLELYPNDPVLQATAYLVLAEAARRSGDPVVAAEFEKLAARLDPAIPGRLAQSTEPSTRTRGDKMSKLDAAMTAFATGAQAYQQVRMAIQQQQMQRMQQQQMKQQMQMQQMQQQAPPPQPYPQQPIQQSYPQQQYPQQQYPQQQYPQQGAAIAYPPVPVNDPSYRQNMEPPAPMPGWQPQQPQQAGGGPMSPQPVGAYPAAPQPYGAPSYPSGTQVTRGAKPQSWKVVHDHTQGGVEAYFAQHCGALLSVDKNQLTFTGSGGEAPLSIPSGDIREIRMNSVIGKEVGAFHVATRQGLYLHLVLDSGDPVEARVVVDALRQALGL